MAFENVGIVGCGLMGAGIAEAAIRSGYATTVREISPELVAKGRARVEKSLQTAVERGKLAAAERDAALSRLSFTTGVEALADCDLVVEAATEDPELKKELFVALDRSCKRAAILASNTSSIRTVTPAIGLPCRSRMRPCTATSSRTNRSVISVAASCLPSRARATP